MAFRCQPDAEPIAGYRLVAPLGGGGFGEIWKCVGPDGRCRAIKIVHGDLAATDPGRRTAEQELHGLRLIGELHHPCLLALERFDVADGRLLIVMELADGSLWDWFRNCRDRGLSGIPRDELLRCLADAADGLDALRDAGLQHLDVKPQNLLRVAGRGKVGDFGLVRELRSGRAGAGASPAYSAPETFAGKLSPHCDLYGLAIVYQELLTGTPPFSGATAEQYAVNHLNEPPNLSALPPADRRVVGRALAKKPTDRFPSCAAFIRALQEPGGSGFRFSEPGTKRRSTIYRPASTLRPTLVIGLGGVGGSVLRNRRLHDEHFDADGEGGIRFLYIDTDTEAVRSAVDGEALAPAEVLPVRLQRSALPIKPPADGRMSGPINWFDPRWQARLSEAGTPAGCRGLGRRAFADNVQPLHQKIEADLTAIGRAGAGPPRVVIVTGLAGGTGSGMVLDVAFLARHLLRRFGNAPEVSGWLLLPPADSGDERSSANAFAALAELRHFTKPDTIYRARCDELADSLTTKEPPFADVVVLTDADAMAAGLRRELLTPRPASQPAAASPPSDCRTFGEVRLAWPRPAILRHAALRLAAGLLEHWVTADAAAVAGPIRSWLAGQWSALELGPDAVSKRLQSMAATADDLARESGTRLARLAVTVLEQPDLRLAGAEAAVRLLSDRVEKVIAHAGPSASDLRRKAEAARGTNPAAAARGDYQSLLVQQVAAIFTTLRGQLADQLAEIEICRKRLGVALESLRGERRPDPSDSGWLLPSGCGSIADAAGQIAIGADDLRELDRRIQGRLIDTAGGLARACLTDADLSQTLGPALVGLAEAMLAPRLGCPAADLFLARHPDPATAFKEMRTAAAPKLGSDSGDVTTVDAPAALADVVRQTFGDVALAESADEIAVIQSARLSLTALPHFGPAARAAYLRRKAAGDSPHSRQDLLIGPNDLGITDPHTRAGATGATPTPTP
jgi:hypothetical protein